MRQPLKARSVNKHVETLNDFLKHMVEGGATTRAISRRASAREGTALPAGQCAEPRADGALIGCLRGGANMYHVKELLGHESLETLKHYARLTITDLKATHATCHPREKEGCGR